MSDRYEQPGYNTYVDDWHTPLNNNFFNIGADIDALEAEKADADGAGTASLSNYAAIDTDELSPTPAGDISHSIWSTVTSGHWAAIHPQDGMYVIDPTDYQNTQTAIEALNSHLISKSPPGGTIAIAPFKTDGSVTSIQNQITLGDSAGQVPICLYDPIGYAGGAVSNSDYNRIVIPGSNITAGEPAFVFEAGGLTDGSCILLGEVDGAGSDTALVRLNNQRHFTVHVRFCEKISTDHIQLSSSVNGYIDGVYAPNQASASILSAVSGSNTDIRILPSVRTIGYEHLVHDNDGAANLVVRLNGHHENGDNGIPIDLRGSGSAVRFMSGTVGCGPGSPTNNTVVYMNGGSAFETYGGYIANGSAGIDLDGTLNRVKISPAFGFINFSGDAINIANAPSNIGVVPNAALVDGTVTYPTGMEAIGSTTT